jgi:hypothetical protein
MNDFLQLAALAGWAFILAYGEIFDEMKRALLRSISYDPDVALKTIREHITYKLFQFSTCPMCLGTQLGFWVGLCYHSVANPIFDAGLIGGACYLLDKLTDSDK